MNYNEGINRQKRVLISMASSKFRKKILKILEKNNEQIPNLNMFQI